MAIALANTSFAQVPSYIPTSGLVGWWPFNGNANDESGVGNNGTVYGAVALTADRFGNLNSAYSWPSDLSSSNYIDLGDLNSYLPNSISISCWVYFDAATNDSRVISTGEPGIIVYQDSGSVVTIKCSYGPAGVAIWPSTFGIAKYEWHHILYTADHSTNVANLYVDGVLTDTDSSDAPMSTPENWNVGRKSISAFDGFGGLIDDIGIWNRALTSSEVLAIYYSGTVGIEDHEANAGITLYPNPADGNVTIRTNDQIAGVPYHVYDSLGNCVLQGLVGDGLTTIGLNGIAPGVYSVRIEGTNKVLKLVRR
ncbi:MAG: T9SS type A sorting domain-containing protein [Flavobacteriales bacterium]|nr:T9SS type A sorting domain-containing protein [Flavobacteriales bacterium]